MSKHDLQNEGLDQIGRALFKDAGRARHGKIEKIVVKPQLFDSIRAGIKAKKNAPRKQKSYFGDWASLFVRNRLIAAGAFAILIMFVTAASLIIFNTQNLPPSFEQTTLSMTQPQITQIENLPHPEIKESISFTIKNSVRAKQITFKPETSKLPKRAPTENQVKVTQSVKKEMPQVFYALGFVGDLEASGEDLKVVHTELSSTELFTLGVNVPVGNEADKIKTVLLVGSNGIPKAIKFAK